MGDMSTSVTMPSDQVPASQIIEEIRKRRADSGRLVAGVAAASNSDMFKGPQDGKPKAKRWDHHLTEESKLRQPCALKLAAQHLKKPGLISLGSGLPASSVFPFASLSMAVPSVPSFSEAAPVSPATVNKYDIRDGAAEYDLSVALNYGQACGSAQMARFLTEHAEVVHRPPYADWAVCQTIGNTGALEQAARMLCDRDRRDAVLTEAFGFSTAMETFEPLRVGVFGTAIDSEGIVAEAMDELLSGWDEAARGGFRRPHVLYTVPSGQNPTGATQSPARRRAVYAVARKHDMIIIEDEPYYFLQMDPYGQDAAPPTNIDEFVASLVPSYVSIDVDGRVLRMDSFSKVLAPGARLGWIVASQQLVERYQRHAEVASQGPSGFSQVLLHKLLEDSWGGHAGYLQWLMHLRGVYAQKRDALLAACERHLPRDLVSWTPPAAGMFVWLTVDHAKHPDHGTRKLEDIEQEIFDAGIDGGVLVARGSWFRAEQHVPLSGLYFRITYATASPEDMDTATSRFGDAVRSSFKV
ncbi:Pyridoxal phosphate-dependent transferase, major domain protein [Cordyceps fumosorosea ARSEF 2679]|uniref:aromatic-amino-acid transaminase n=1 Tax=Cordyceps fumosorosea (strain ARSEF 2679) TaxID=1081104 RepID=A0A167WM49_CORFA|nr:Pyridoxal phosphate-dependent transferase, major domain protein [Cordyceps fumosorosea ARSEF 2679]OAA63963.1 Pyridoxal phosphate-dependent transferase, major domain protein [Cordyceps fumosorosea ARSEF 2679]